MGGGESRIQFGKGDISLFLLESNNFFNTDYDDLSYRKKYYSVLKSKNPNKVVKEQVLPDQAIISDLIIDPVAYGNYQNPSDAFRKIILPLFAGQNESKPFDLQILEELLIFLQKRPQKFVDEALIRKQEENDSMNRLKINSLIEIKAIFENLHYKHDVNEDISYEDEVMGKILRKFISNAIVESPMVTFSPQIESIISYYLLTKTMTNEMAGILFECSILAGDLKTYLACTKFFHQNISKKYKLRFVEIGSKSRNLIGRIPLDNGLFIPFDECRVSTTIMGNYLHPTNNMLNLLTTDGKNIYALEKMCIRSIPLSEGSIQGNNKYKLNYAMCDMDGLNILYCDGYIILFSKSMSPVCYKTDPFTEMKDDIRFEKPGLQLTEPFASDGKLIYCLNSNKINVFKLDFPVLKCIRAITLVKSHYEIDNSNPKLISPEWKNGTAYSNGSVFQICLLNFNIVDHYSYITRSFSLVDGSHLGDCLFSLKYPITSIVYDPFHNYYYSSSPVDIGLAVLRYATYGAQASWMTGYSPELIKGMEKVKHGIISAKNNNKALKFAVRYLNYYTFHIAGMSVKQIFFLSKGYVYSVEESMRKCGFIFFSPANSETIQVIFDTFKYFLKFRSEPKIQTFLVTLINLLNLNLINYERRLKASGIIDEIVCLNELVELFLSILDREKYQFIHSSIIFLFINSFSTLFTFNIAMGKNVFLTLYNKTAPDVQLFMVSQISKLRIFVQIIDTNIQRKVLIPIFEKLQSPEKKYTNAQFELVNNYSRALTLEMYKIFIDHHADLPPMAAELAKSFFSFYGVLTEEFLQFIDTHDNLHDNETSSLPFILYFGKCFMLLQPFTQFSRVAIEMISFLGLIFEKMLVKVYDTMKKENDGMQLIFFEVFSLYSEFLNSLLCGGSELNDIQKYQWLIRATIESKLKPKDVDEMMQTIFSPNSASTKQKSMLQRGFSFNITKNLDYQPNQIQDFINSMVNENESETISSLFNYFYKKVRNNMFKPKSSEERMMDRLMMAVYMKQLGFSYEVMDISIKLSSKKTPVLSHIIKQVIEDIYRIRSTLKRSKQKTITIRHECEVNSLPITFDKIEDDYDTYITIIKRKCVFLLHIQPCLRFQSTDYESDFCEMLKKLHNFIIGTISIEEYYELLTASSKAQRNSKLGITLINNVIQHKANTLSSFIINKFATNDVFFSFVSSLKGQDLSKDHGFKEINKMFIFIKELIANDLTNPSLTSLITFFATLAISLSSIQAEIIVEPFISLMTNLMENESKYSPVRYQAIISFLFSLIYVITNDNPYFYKSNSFSSLTKFFQKEMIDKSMCTIRVADLAGIKLDIKTDKIIEILTNANPDQYKSLTGYLKDILMKAENMLPVLEWIMNEIATVSSGQYGKISSHLPTILELKEGTKNIRTPTMVRNAISYLINICRQLLKNDDLTIKSILSYILMRYQNMEISGEERMKFAMFNDEKFIFAVFAILSNIPEKICVNSIIKNINTGSIYTIKKVIDDNSFECWQLPLNQDSKTVVVQNGHHIINISKLPFTPNMFDSFDLLIPIFSKYLDILSNTKEDILSIYILNSLQVYSTDAQFLKRFLDKFNKPKINSFSIENPISSCFDQLMKIKLSSTNRENEVLYKWSSIIPTPYNKDNTNLYISKILKTTQCLYVKATGYFYVGFVSHSCHASLNSYNLIYVWKDRHVHPKVILPRLCGTEVLVYFAASEMKGFIKVGDYDYSYDLLPNTSFVVIPASSDFSVEYSISKTPPPGKKLMPLMSLARGNPVFRRKIFIKDTHTEISRPSFDLEGCKVNIDEEDTGRIKFAKTAGGSKQDSYIVTFDETVNDLIKMQIGTWKDYCNKDRLLRSTRQPPVQEIMGMLRINDNFKVVKHYNISELSGKVDEKDFQIKYGINLIDKDKTMTCPSFLTDLYFNELSIETQQYTLCKLFQSRFLNDPSSAMKVFNIDMHLLVKMFLVSLTCIEPIDQQNIIDFSINVMIEDSSTNHISEITFVKAVLSYVQKDKLEDEFAKSWMNILEDYFKDSNMQTICINHPHALFLPMSQLINIYTINNPEKEDYIFMPYGIDNRFDLAKVNSQVIGFEKQIYFFKDTEQFQLTLPDDGSIHQRKLAIIHFKSNDNLPLINTFFQTAVSFKYLGLYLSTSQSRQKRNHIFHLFKLFAIGLIGRSPYFYQFQKDVFKFLNSIIETSAVDIKGDFLEAINLLDMFEHENYRSFISEKFEEYDDFVTMPSKSFFPELISKEEAEEISKLPNITFQLPIDINSKLNCNDQDYMEKLFGKIKKIYINKNLESFPFTLFFSTWATYRQMYPKYKAKNIDDFSIRITFETKIHVLSLIYEPKTDVAFTFSYKQDFSEPIPYKEDLEITSQEIYMKCNVELHKVKYVIKTSEHINNEDYILANREAFVSDIKEMALLWNPSIDQKIISCFPSSVYQEDLMNTNVDPIYLAKIKLSMPHYLLCVRARFNLILNWLFSSDVDMRDNKELAQYLSPSLNYCSFINLIPERPPDSPSFNIMRQNAYRVREGISTDFKSTIISQMLKDHPENWTNSTNQPWKVNFDSESGIDCGGPARELLVEATVDIMTPNCGLTIFVPNHVNQVGMYRDYLIPIPHPRMYAPERHYYHVGCIIAVIIRTRIAQTLPFAPLVWDYLITGRVNIDLIYQIDDTYKMLIESLRDAHKNIKSNDDFLKNFNLTYTIRDFRGNEVALALNGLTERLTLEKIQEFISSANQYRINELKMPLENIRRGLMDNLGITSFPPLMQWHVLEFATCGDQVISVDVLKKITSFWGIPQKQQEYFWRVVEEFTPEQRVMLLKFWTSRTRLPPNAFKLGDDFLIVDQSESYGDDSCPTASTCFNKLHWSNFSSYDKAYQLIKVAIEYTGTFENS